MNWFYLVLCFIGGIGLSFQASVNSELGRKIGTIEVSCLAYTVGAIILFIMACFFGKGNMLEALNFPKWKLFVGIFGALFIYIIILSVPKIGIASAIIAGIVGQMFLSMIIDHYGLFGNIQTPINVSRILGLALMFLSTYLFYTK
ncbi:DMT family transporter [Pelosinus propionicus]|uniref:Transporter family-2 protein n=1 Tax=Pelosinus propionicus DSM 13327 TaxID=1123291 RepID=A0A1I4NIA1_9FIRM|nr:DMT family transporter [Pelosinus propionicus]SFM15189.1 transporter family-2 protein [Pelosinus propionicus DSM 13327]